MFLSTPKKQRLIRDNSFPFPPPLILGVVDLNRVISEEEHVDEIEREVAEDAAFDRFRILIDRSIENPRKKDKPE